MIELEPISRTSEAGSSTVDVGDQIRWYVMTGPSLANLRHDYMDGARRAVARAAEEGVRAMGIGVRISQLE